MNERSTSSILGNVPTKEQIQEYLLVYDYSTPQIKYGVEGRLHYSRKLPREDV
ncbi:hypothetical protein REC12_00710 [Desulfosporosinus sp. PR]|nr:hypothetical protein [Desulfosporosinus sp. PR]